MAPNYSIIAVFPQYSVHTRAICPGIGLILHPSWNSFHRTAAPRINSHSEYEELNSNKAAHTHEEIMPHGASATGDTHIILTQESFHHNCNDAFWTLNGESFTSIVHFYELHNQIGPHFKTQSAFMLSTIGQLISITDPITKLQVCMGGTPGQ